MYNDLQTTEIENGESKLPAYNLRLKGRLATRNVVLIGFLAATLTVGKLALSFIPNVEAVTVLILVYGACFGRKIAVPAAVIFCAVEIALYGFNTWVVLYFIHWSTLALVGSVFLKPHKLRLLFAVIIAAVATTLFGVLDSAIYVTFAAISGVPNNALAALFVTYYVRGAYFYIVHIASNIIVVTALFLPLTAAVSSLAKKYAAV